MSILDSVGTRRALEERLLVKQKEIGERLSGLKSDLTRNPLTEVARSHPLATVGTALAGGLLVGLLLRRSRAGSADDPDLMVDLLTEKVLSELPSSAHGHLASDELRRIVRAEAIALMPSAAPRHRPPTFLGEIIGTVGRNLLWEGMHYALGRLAQHLPTREE